MKKEEFFNIMNDIDDDLLAREDRASANVKKLLARKLTVLVAAVLVIAVCLSVVVPMVGKIYFYFSGCFRSPFGFFIFRPVFCCCIFNFKLECKIYNEN